MQVPVNPMDYKKLVRKTIGVIVGTLVIFAIGITLVILVAIYNAIGRDLAAKRIISISLFIP